MQPRRQALKNLRLVQRRALLVIMLVVAADTLGWWDGDDVDGGGGLVKSYDSRWSLVGSGSDCLV